MPNLTIMNRNLVAMGKKYQRAKLPAIHLKGRLNSDFYVNTLIKKGSKKLLQGLGIN